MSIGALDIPAIFWRATSKTVVLRSLVAGACWSLGGTVFASKAVYSLFALSDGALPCQDHGSHF